MKSFQVCIAVPPDREDTHIIKQVADSDFIGSVTIFIYNNNKKIREVIEYAKTKKDVEVIKLKNYRGTTLHGDVRIWNGIKDSISSEYILFILSTISSVPVNIFTSDNLPNLVLVSNDPQRKSVQEFMLVNNSLIRRYTPDKDLPFLSFLELLRQNNIQPMWAPAWSTMPINSKFPSWLYVEITTKCNLDCKYCIRDQRKGDMMSLETFKEIVTKFDKSSKSNIVGINLIGLGEVMLHPEFSAICDYIDSKKWMLTFTTNGTVFNEEIYRNLPARTEIYVSLDGTDDNGVFKQNRNIPASHVMSTIAKIRNVRPHIPITIQPVLVKGALPEILSLATFANNMKCKLHPTLPVLSNEKIFKEMYPSEDEIRSMNVILRNSTRNLSQNLFDVPQYRECFDPFNLLLVLINGDVYPCCFVNTVRTQKEEYYNGSMILLDTDQYILGNIFKDNVEEIVESETLYKVRNKICQTLNTDFTKRKEVDMTDATEYCKICLARWKRGC